MSNTFGTIFKLTTFGESHGPAIGGIIEGCPAGLVPDMELIRRMLERRRPGQSAIASPRNEQDEVEFLSGMMDGVTTGTPIGFIIRNNDARPGDYDALKELYRPSHADFTYESKYSIRDHRGSGRASARETVCRVVAGALALSALHRQNIRVNAWVHSIGGISIPERATIDLSLAENNPVRCPHTTTAEAMVKLLEKTRDEGDSLGGMIVCSIKGMPPGIGEPVFDKLNALLGHAILSIPAVKGIEFGSGFAAAGMKGSEHNDVFVTENNRITTGTNHSGGIQGGISNGNEILLRVAFKPVATIRKEQPTVNRKGEAVTVEGKGRHDACVVPRAVPVVEAMAALILFDLILRQRAAKF